MDDWLFFASATVEAAALQCEGDRETSVSALGRALNLDKSSASRRVKQATEAGYLVNHETTKGKAARLTLGEPLPEDVLLLPLPEDLCDRCTVASDLENTGEP